MLWFILGLLAAFFDATYYAFNKKALKKLSVYLVPILTAFTSGIVLLLISIMKGFPVLQKNFFYFVVIGAILNTISQILFFKALKSADISMVIPLLSFTPIFLMLTSFLMLNERVNLYGATAIIFIVSGAYAINFERKNNIFRPLKELFKNKSSFYAIIVSILFSIIANMDKIIILKSNVFFGYAAENLVIGLLFLVICLFRKEKFNSIKGNAPFLILIGIIGILSSLTFGFAVRMQIVPYIISLKRTSILFSVLYGAVIFKEQKIKQRLVAASIMLVGVILIAFA